MVSEHEWNTIGWLEEARSLLNWLNTLDSGPVLLMVRHSERVADTDVHTTIKADLTDFGHKIALEFGRRLPKRWKTTIYYSPHIRTAQTAKEIAKGLQEKEDCLQELEELNVLLGGRGDIEKIITLAYDISFDEFYWRWTRNEIPTDTIEPFDHYIQRLTQQVRSSFSTAGVNDLHIHVTHDIVVASSRSIYLDLPVSESPYVSYLAGYGIAGIEGKQSGFKDKKPVKVVRSPST